MTDAATLSTPRVSIEQTDRLQVWVLRFPGAPGDRLQACGDVLGAPLPCEPNRAAGRELRLLWLAPDEWAIVSRNAAAGLAGRLGEACGDALHHLADLRAGWTAFHLTGEGAADVIAQGCSLDLHPAVFGPDRCARTLLAQVEVLIERPPFLDGFAVYVDRSLAGHLRAWFARAVAAGAPCR